MQNLTSTLLPLLTHGFNVYREKQTASTLGDRSTYVGMSDIARAVECLRSVVASKLSFSKDSENLRLSRELRLQRGHWFEAGVKQVFDSMNLPFIHQLEIQTVHQGVPINAHLDFVLLPQNSRQPQVHIVEVKSCENMPDVVYASYEMQIMGQLSLLKALWSQPCFSACNLHTGFQIQGRTFPQLVQELFNMSLPEDPDIVQIEGSILMLSMSDAKAIGSYKPNTIMEQACYKLAKQIWHTVQQVNNKEIGLDQVSYAQGFYPLCDYCEHNAQCPRFDGIDADDLENLLQELIALRAHKNTLQDDIKLVENRLKNTIETVYPGGDWITAYSHRVRVSNCQRQDQTYQRLYISPVNKGALHE